MKKIFAFTLAEVLITVTIIGVVAAITLPTFIQNYQKHIFVNQLRKSHSLISQAFQRMIFDERATSFSETKYARNRYSYNGAGEYLAKYVKVVNSEYLENSDNEYINMDNTPVNDDLKKKILLSDGSIIFDNGSYFYIDVNGEEGPNIMDRDLFKFSISTAGQLVPYTQNGIVGYEKDEYGVEDTNRPIFGSDSDCTANGCGATRIINAGWVMDY